MMHAAAATVATATAAAPSPSLWLLAWRRLQADRLAMLSLAIVMGFLLLTLASASGLIAGDWAREVGVSYAPPSLLPAASVSTPGETAPAATTPTTRPPPPDNPYDPLAADLRELRAQIAAEHAHKAHPPATAIDSYGIIDPLAEDMAAIHAQQAASGDTPAHVEKRHQLPLGADKWGRDVLQKTIKGTQTSITVGLMAAVIATIIGTLLGAVAGYYGRWVDDLLNWFYNIFTSLPYLLLILAIAAVLPRGKGLTSIVLILSLTGWTGVFRQIRAEYLKHKVREYVLAADAIGASHARMTFIHILPNISHVALVQMSILAVGFIKAEVILSFLGFGVPVDAVSWGSMLNEAQNELILGKWWQLAAATGAMALLVTAFSLFTDALRDALDPKLK